MVGHKIRSENSIRVVVVPITNEYKEIFGRSVVLECYCKLEKVKTKKSRVIKNILNEIKSTQSWSKKYSPTFSSRLSLIGKLLIKSPIVLTAILFQFREYTFIGSIYCQTHLIKEVGNSSIWYSNSAARIGFPWAREVFINSLDVIRNHKIGVLIFSFSEVNNSLSKDVFLEQIQSVREKINKKIYVELDIDLPVDDNQILASWNSSKLVKLENSVILHGTVLLSNKKFINQDVKNTPWGIPGRMSPCSVWVDERLRPQHKPLITPNTHKESRSISSGLFINANLSFYHFISESIRPLIQALQMNIHLQHIIIRNDLPIQFYQLIRSISPTSELVLIGQGEKISANNLLAGIIEDRLSHTNKVFREYSLEQLKQSDEWGVWSWIRNFFQVDELSNEITYLPRGKSESRGIVNSNSLQKLLINNNVGVLNTAKEDFSSQLVRFRNTKLVCSTSGASLVNLIFMPAGSSLLELTYPVGHSWKFLADLCGIKHVNYPITAIKPKKLESVFDTYYVNRKKLNATLQRLAD
jgi:hypothetical protein